VTALWGITTFFNPTRSRRRIDNFRRFRAASAKQGLPLVAVELAFEDGEDFELEPERDGEILVRRRAKSVLWQKERLLNLGLAALPPECTKVCWIDADVLFADDDWVEACTDLLRRDVVIQPFSEVVRLPEGGRPEDFPASLLGRGVSLGSGDGSYSVSCCSKLDRLISTFGGTTGYAWCARRSLLDAHGFYDRCIVGGGDRELALAIAYPPGRAPKRNVRIHHTRLRDHIRPWAAKIHADVGKRIGHRPGLLHHLSHGSASGRNYVDRHAILVEHDFDPERDIALDEGGCWAWTGTNPGLEAAVARYFAARREDG
jgi:hypothetical protein